MCVCMCVCERERFFFIKECQLIDEEGRMYLDFVVLHITDSSKDHQCPLELLGKR